MLVSALMTLGSYATCPEFAGNIHARASPTRSRRCGNSSLAFVSNVCIGNTDDHARNPAASWDGADLSVTPPYDLCPQPRYGEAAQAMAVARAGTWRSQFVVCLDAAEVYLLTRAQAADSVTPADGFADLLDAYLGSGVGPTEGGVRPHLTLTASARDLAGCGVLHPRPR